MAEYAFMRSATRLVGHRWADVGLYNISEGALAWDGYLDTCLFKLIEASKKKTPINAHVQRARAADVIRRHLINRI